MDDHFSRASTTPTGVPRALQTLTKGNHPDCYHDGLPPQQRCHMVQEDHCNVMCYLSLVEINVGIICACLPTMRPLLTRSFPQVFGTTGARDTADTGSYAMNASHSSAMKRAFNKVQNNEWTTMDGIQKSAVRDENDSESVRAIVKNDVREEPTSVKATDYSVTNEPRHWMYGYMPAVSTLLGLSMGLL